MSTPRALRFAVLAVPALLAAGCQEGTSQRELMNVAGAWFAAVHDRDFARLSRFDARAPDPGTPEFAAWAADIGSRLDSYEIQKAEGNWRPDDIGYVTTKAFLLGPNPGTFWGAPGREGTTDEPVLIIQATFAYDEVGEQRLPEGTKVYVQGYPVGRVYRMEIGGKDQRQIAILDRIRLKVHLKKMPPRNESEFPYKVARLEIIPGSEQHRTVTWIF